MTKTIFIFLVIFSFVLAGFWYIAVVSQNNQTAFRIPFYSNPTPTAIPPFITLTLVPENTAIIKNQQNTINILYDAQRNTNEKPKIIQVEISYDPNALSDVAITPGDFFTNPTVPLQIINTHTGRISYAIKTSAENQKTTGIVARLTFTPNPAFSDLQTPVSFLGKTMIRSITGDNILTAVYGTQLVFASGSASPKQ